MSARTVIDGLEFSRADKEMRGSLHAAELARLQDSLFDAEGQVDFLLKGGRDRRGRPTLYLEISGLLRLRCQRCMGPLHYPLYVANTLLLVRADEPLPEETDAPDAPDCVVAGAAMDVGTLIEDEIVFELPFAPRHPAGTCGVRDDTGYSKHAALPFAGLAALKK
jgi:DUF177 domain-containing protein